MKEFITHFENFFSKTSVTVGAPVGGSVIGLVGYIEKIIPVITFFSLIVGITLGIMSYMLKRKLVKRQLRDIEEHPHEHHIQLKDES